MLRIRVDPLLHDDLRWAAERRGLDVSSYLRRLAEQDITRLKRRARR